LNWHPFLNTRTAQMESPSARTFRFYHPPTEARWEASPARRLRKRLSTNLASEAGWMKRLRSPAKRLHFCSPSGGKGCVCQRFHPQHLTIPRPASFPGRPNRMVPASSAYRIACISDSNVPPSWIIPQFSTLIHESFRQHVSSYQPSECI